MRIMALLVLIAFAVGCSKPSTAVSPPVKAKAELVKHPLRLDYELAISNLGHHVSAWKQMADAVKDPLDPMLKEFKEAVSKADEELGKAKQTWEDAGSPFFIDDPVTKVK